MKSQNKVYLIGVVIVFLIYLVLRLDIFYSLPISRGSWMINILLGLLDAVLIYSISRKFLDIPAALISVLVYASSPLIAYYEFFSSNYLILLACFLVVTKLLLMVHKDRLTTLYLMFFISFLILLLILIRVIQPTLLLAD